MFSNIDLQTNPGTGLLAQGAIANAFGNPDDPISQAFAAAFGGLALDAPLFTNLDAIVGVPGAQAGFTEGVRQNIISGLEGLQFQPQFLSLPNAIEDGRTDDDEFTYSIKGSYEVNDNLNAYVGYSTGFKASSCLLYTSPSPRDLSTSRMPSSA